MNGTVRALIGNDNLSIYFEIRIAFTNTKYTKFLSSRLSVLVRDYINLYKSRRLTTPLIANLAYATARLISPSIGKIGENLSAEARSLPWNLSCFSSPLVKSLCLIIVILAIVAMAAREAFKMNRVLNPFLYPFSKMVVIVDGEIPSVEGEASEDGLLMIVFIKPEGRASSCMVDLNELFLWNHNHQREKKTDDGTCLTLLPTQRLEL